ncbi:hypothetical protein ACFLRC_00955 [Candidatus Altiarchaeota archaeon]
MFVLFQPANPGKGEDLEMDKQYVTWVMGFLVIFLLANDFWSWSRAEPLMLGLPYWVVYLFLLNFVLAFYYYLLAERRWSD